MFMPVNLFQVVYEYSCTLQDIFNYLLEHDEVKAYVFLNEEDNGDISQAGFCEIPQALINELWVKASNDTKFITKLEIIHMLEVMKHGKHNIFQSIPPEYINGLSHGKSYRINKQKILTPKDYEKNGYPAWLAYKVTLESPLKKQLIDGAVLTTQFISMAHIFISKDKDLVRYLKAIVNQRTGGLSLFDQDKDELTEKEQLLVNIKKALVAGKHAEESPFENRMSLIVKELGYDFEPGSGLVEHYSYVFSKAKIIKNNKKHSKVGHKNSNKIKSI